MKKNFCIIFLMGIALALSSLVNAQSPDAISYQSVVRANDGSLLSNSPISVKVSILQASAQGESLYSESFNPTTNGFGQVAFSIGQGNKISGDFKNIAWGDQEKFIKVEIDPTGGQDYTLSSTSQLMTVPYAKYADVAGSIADEDKYVLNDNRNVIDKVIVLKEGENTAELKSYINAGYRSFVLQGGVQYQFTNVILPSDVTITGNGATVITGNTSYKCFIIRDVKNVRLRDINFKGSPDEVVGKPLLTTHVAVHIQRSQDVAIDGCVFSNWQGAGIVAQGAQSGGISYFDYRTTVTNNKFEQCFFGISIADRSEYGNFTGNILTSCRVGTWHTSGNWMINSNNYVSCGAPYLSIGKTSPFGSQSSDNWNHGSLVGNIMNHANSGGHKAWRNTPFTVGGASINPHGVVISHVLPPTFTGNTLYYTDLDFTDVMATSTNTPWHITGNVFAQMSIKANAANRIAMVGSSFQANVTVSPNVTQK